MQPLAQNGYSAEEVVAQLTGPSRSWSFRYHLLSGFDNSFLGVLTSVVACSVEYNALADVRGKAKFILEETDEVNYLSDRIQPWVRLAMPKSPPTILNPLPGIKKLARWGFDTRFSLDVNDEAPEVTAGPFIATGTSIVWPNVDSGYEFFPCIGIQAGADNQTAESALELGRFVEFTITPANFMELDHLTFLASRGGPSTPRGLVLTTSLDGYETPLLMEDTPTARPEWYRYRVNLSALPVVDGEPVTFRLYAYGPTATNQVDVDEFTLFGRAYAAKPQTVPDDRPGYVEWPQGVYLLATPTRKVTAAGRVLREVEGYDQGLVLRDDLVAEREFIEAGTLYTDAAVSVANLAIPQLSVIPSNLELPTDREWKPGTSRAAIIADLLNAVNYAPLVFDASGVGIIRPYQSPQDVAPAWNYANDEVSVMLPEVEQERDLFGIANRWLLVASEPDLPPLVSTRTNDSFASPTSTVSRGRVITDFRESEGEVPDQATLDARVERLAFEASQVYEAVEFTTGLQPFHEHAEVYSITFSHLGLAAKFSEHTWSYDLRAGATMKHRARRVVAI